MTVNLGLQLSTAQSHFACVSSVFSVLNLSFLELSRPGLHARASSCRPHTQNLTLHVQEWNLKWWTQKKPRLPPSTPYYSSESEFRSGCSSQGIEKGGRDVFLSHHAPATGPKLAQRVGQFLQGKASCLQPWLPLRQTCQRHPLSTTRGHHLLKRNQRPRRRTPPSQAWLTFRRGQQCSLCRRSAAAKLDVPHSRRCSGSSERRLRKQLLGDEKLMWYYHVFDCPCRILIFLSLLCFWMMHRWHTNHYRALVRDAFASDLGRWNFNVVCRLWWIKLFNKKWYLHPTPQALGCGDFNVVLVGCTL